MALELTMVKEIRHVEGGYIVVARHPYGGSACGYGEVVCKTFDEVVELLKKCDVFGEHGNV